MIISNNNKSNSASDAFKYYGNIFMIFYAQIIMQLRKGHKPTQTKVFLALGSVALIVVLVLNLFHVIDITGK
jgi:hypothetical protein